MPRHSCVSYRIANKSLTSICCLWSPNDWKKFPDILCASTKWLFISHFHSLCTEQ